MLENYRQLVYTFLFEYNDSTLDEVRLSKDVHSPVFRWATESIVSYFGPSDDGVIGSKNPTDHIKSDKGTF